MIKNKKQAIILSLILVELSFIFLTFMSYQNKVVESKETSKVDREKFAMYRENMDGEYEEITSTNGMINYGLNTNKTFCVDNNKEKVLDIITFTNSKVTVKTNKTVYCYLYFDILKDLIINVNTEGEDGTVPATLGYNKTISCNNGSSPVWNYKYNRLEFSNVLGDEEVCNLTYTKDTNTYTTLRDTVENDSEVVHEKIYRPKADAEWEILATEDDYGTITNNSTYPFVFDETTKKWTGTTPGTTSSDSLISSIFTFYPKEDAYYQVCYELPASSMVLDNSWYLNAIDFYNLNELTATAILSSNHVRSNNKNGETKIGCYDYGYVTTSDYIKFIQQYYDKNISFYVQKTTNDEVVASAGYRYQGTNPDNYVWFNNEMWRIIGSIPTKISEDGTIENRIKIIRKNSIGGIDLDTNFTLLNDYYFGQKDASSSNYCRTASSIANSCDYTTRGISEIGYGKMVENIYWNTGYDGYHFYTEDYYLDELAEQSLKMRVGIISVSDYGYAKNNSFKIPICESNDSYQIYTSENWLADQTGRFINNNNSIYQYNGVVDGTIYYNDSNSYQVKPTIYLNSLVYVLDGDGSEENPYIISMK